jgi:hypothetical protein
MNIPTIVFLSAITLGSVGGVAAATEPIRPDIDWFEDQGVSGEGKLRGQRTEASKAAISRRSSYCASVGTFSTNSHTEISQK